MENVCLKSLKIRTPGYFVGWITGAITAAVASGVAFVSFLKYWAKKQNE